MNHKVKPGKLFNREMQTYFLRESLLQRQAGSKVYKALKNLMEQL